jgi:exonuclease VII large subunit
VQTEAGNVIPAAAELKVGDRVGLRFADGIAKVAVEEIEKRE